MSIPDPYGSVQHIARLATPYVDGVHRHSFELVQDLSSKLYVYAALWNVESVRLITIMVQGHKFRNLWCVLYFSVDKSNPGVYVRPIVAELHTYKSPYTSASITCPYEYTGNVPLFVGFVEDKAMSPGMTFVVENYGEKSGVTKEFTVCVPSLFNMKSAALLVEKIEMSRILGAGRVVFYNTSISSNVDAVLRMYAREWSAGRETLEVVVLPWQLPIENGETISIPYKAQQLTIDDCMYRYKRLSNYMVFDDLDEFLVPLQHHNWSALVKDRRRLKPTSIGWAFRCTVLNKDRPNPAKGYGEDYLRYGSAIFGLTSRDQYVYPAGDRTKLIVDPTTIEEMGVHLIWSGRGTTDVLPVTVGLLFHYRVPLEDCTGQVDETRVVAKYGERLRRRFREIWSRLEGVEPGFSPFKAANKSKCNSLGTSTV